MEYSFEYALPEIMEGAATGIAGISLGIFAIVYLLLMAFGIVCYVLYAVGLYRIAKRRGIHHAWLAWIPVGSEWLLGSISDHYQYVAKQNITKRRRTLIVLSILVLVFSGMAGGGVAALVLNMDAAAGITVAGVALTVVGYLGAIGIGIAIMVFYYSACYDLFRSCKPSYDVLFLILGILFSVTMPFFIFACSGSDQGMPARRPRPAPQIPYEQPAQPEPPVVQTEVVDETYDL